MANADEEWKMNRVLKVQSARVRASMPHAAAKRERSAAWPLQYDQEFFCGRVGVGRGQGVMRQGRPM